MENLFYFQRYSTKENWVTNNTLLLLKRLQQFSPAKFQVALSNIFDQSQVSFEVGVKFHQQVKVRDSVLDGRLTQQGFMIAVETKLYDNFREGQLKEHLQVFQSYTGIGILLALSKNKTKPELDAKILREIKSL